MLACGEACSPPRFASRLAPTKTRRHSHRPAAGFSLVVDKPADECWPAVRPGHRHDSPAGWLLQRHEDIPMALRLVRRIRGIRKADRIQHMAVAVDLGQIEDVHGLKRGLHGRAQRGRHVRHHTKPGMKSGPRLIEQHAQAIDRAVALRASSHQQGGVQRNVDGV